MIQRIQTIYLFLSVLSLGALLSGVTILNFSSPETSCIFNVFGLFWKNNGDALYEPDLLFPYYILLILLMLMHLATIFNFKKLKKQLKWAQYSFLIYVISGLALLIFWLAGGEMFDAGLTVTPAIGLFLFIAGIPFSFLAVKAIKKDKALIDSSDRIR
ncbi:MAG: DUF4293 domain-containing protein [Cryomorphaceae bacterium]|jgi:hypothetical protein|nr:DUF4293 domain-containing protein [Cryomorphaceae bacterium]